MLALLWLNAFALLAYSLLHDFSLAHSLLESVPVAVFGVLASFGSSRKVRAALVATGLLTASALLVHAMDGYIEAHFHFFVMIALLTLYEDWIPFSLAAAYVVLHHAIVGVVAPALVYNHPDALAHPIKWALVHGGFVMAAAAAAVILWRLNEDLRGEQTRALGHARESEERFRSAFEEAMLGTYLTSPKGRMLRVNPAFAGMLGRSPEELIGKGFQELTHPDDVGSSVAEVQRTLAGRQQGFSTEKRYLHADGRTVWANLSSSLVRDGDGAPVHFVTQVQDITARKAGEEELRHQALHDPLTGLPNRTLLLDRLEQALRHARRLETSVAVLFVDIDRFKVVNDSLGHSVGDSVLKQVVPRLQEAVRGADTVARFGGDEFVILCEDLDSELRAVHIAERVRRELHAPFHLGNDDHFLAASIGISVSGREGEDAGDLLRDADAAMYLAKAAGGARYEIFDGAMREAAMKRLHVEQQVRRGLRAQEFRLHYQPIFSLEGGGIEAVEALIRWERPGEGLVSPAAFLPIAEESGLIVELGEWVLGEACAQAARWREELGDRAPLPIHVNIAARQITQTDLPGIVADALSDAGVPAGDIVLEVTETVLLEDSERPAHTLERLKALGVSIVLDDFGKGYSSLGYVERFPFDMLKIDRSFVARLDRDGSAIVEAILGMARGLHLTVVAEGVETIEQVTQMRELGCEFAQGYYFAQPGPASDIARLVAPATTPLEPATPAAQMHGA